MPSILKPALCIEDQIKQLIERGLIIPEPEKACEILLNNNYYRLNIYFKQRMDVNNRFFAGTCFEQILAYYEIDKWLRNALVRLLEPIEIKLRANLAYYMGLAYDPGCFYDTPIYENVSDHVFLLSQFFEDTIFRKKDEINRHHFENYGGKFPIWVIVENLSFGQISKYFSSLRPDDKKQIARVGFGIDEKILESRVRALGALRNICAHYGYLHERRFPFAPEKSKLVSSLGVTNNMLASLCLSAQELIPLEPWDGFVTSLIEKWLITPWFNISEYGFTPEAIDYLCAHFV